jgi:hypothetical protein
VRAWTANEYIVLDLASEDDSGEWEENAERSLSAIIGVRAEIAAGDLRPLYLAWLAGYGTWERDECAFNGEHDDELELSVLRGKLISESRVWPHPVAPDAKATAAYGAATVVA